jgi:hypothetical protein
MTPTQILAPSRDGNPDLSFVCNRRPDFRQEIAGKKSQRETQLETSNVATDVRRANCPGARVRWDLGLGHGRVDQITIGVKTQ